MATVQVFQGERSASPVERGIDPLPDSSCRWDSLLLLIIWASQWRLVDITCVRVRRSFKASLRAKS